MRYVFCFFFFNFLIFWPHCAIHGILVPRPGIEPASPASEVHSPNHWTPREVWDMWYFYRWENWDRRESSNLPKPQRQVLSGRTGIQSMSANRTLPWHLTPTLQGTRRQWPRVPYSPAHTPSRGFPIPGFSFSSKWDHLTNTRLSAGLQPLFCLR